MKSLFQKISNSTEAEKVIKDATLLLFILVGLELISNLITPGYKGLFWGSAEILLIALLRIYKKSIFGFLIALMFSFTIYKYFQFLMSSSEGILTLLGYFFRIFVCVRVLQATRISQAKSIITSRFVANGYKAYSFLYFVLGILAYMSMFYNGRATNFDYFDLPFSLIGVIGLFGYSFRKKIINLNTWKVYFVFIICWDLSSFFIRPQQQLVADISLKANILLTTFMICFLLPYYAALYFYGYKSSHIWGKQIT